MHELPTQPPWRRLLLELLEFLMPSPCLSCSRPTLVWRPRLGLCVPCRGRLCPLEVTCHRCGEPLPGARIPSGYICGRCRQHPPAFDRLVVLWRYEPPLNAVVQELKFGALAYLGSHLGEALASYAGPILSATDVIVPVPLHWSRLLTRGYNQSEEIARSLSHHLGLPMQRPLWRRRPTKAQTSLPRHRRQTNLEGAFRLRRGYAIRGRNVTLVDDVMTTGATLSNSASTLKKAGAAAVVAVVAARTLPPRSEQTAAGRNLEDVDWLERHRIDPGPLTRQKRGSIDTADETYTILTGGR